MALKTLSLLLSIRSEAANFNGLPPPHSANTLPHLSLTKPSWVIRTESNVRRKRRKKPDPPCVVCEGSGRVDCRQCHGRGRTNLVHLEMLPKGEWPKWCRTCGGSGLTYCSRCVGTGEYRWPWRKPRYKCAACLLVTKKQFISSHTMEKLFLKLFKFFLSSSI